MPNPDLTKPDEDKNLSNDINNNNDEETTPLELSDEDFFKLKVPAVEDTNKTDLDGDDDDKKVKSDSDDKIKDNDDDDISGNSDSNSDDGKKKEDDDDDDSSKKSDDDDNDGDKKVIKDPDDDDKKVTPKNKDDDDDKKNKSKSDDDGFDYKAEYKKLTAPFKANGTEMNIKSTDDAIRLMQMGANYHKKMSGLKPVLKTVKLLEKNGLMDEGKLNFLIDLSNQDPAAITKLLKDSKLDPMDLNIKDDSTYTPTHRSVSDAEVELDQVLDDIQLSEAYPKTLDIVTKQWDEASRNVVAQQPNIISVINGHVGAGIYDKVMGAVNYERSLGNLNGVSDFEAYKQMGDALHAAGKLGNTPSKKSDENPDVIPKKEEKDKQRKKRKKAVQPNLSVPSTTPATFNPLELSDEDFEKFDIKKFMKKKSS